jgi:fluoride ion exporter CrcB/FEX
LLKNYVQGAMGGALLRWKTSVIATKYGLNPWSTVGINIFGSFILGAVTANQSRLSPRSSLLIGTGFCGAL